MDICSEGAREGVLGWGRYSVRLGRGGAGRGGAVSACPRPSSFFIFLADVVFGLNPTLRLSS